MVNNKKKYKIYTISFRISEKLYLDLLELSEKKQMSISEVIREAVKEFLSREKKK